MSMVAVKQPYVLFLVNDASPQNPRTEQDNFGKMICFHRRYNIGDEHNYDEPDEFLMELLEEKIGDTNAAEDKFTELTLEVDDSLYKSHYGQYRKAIHENVLDYLSSSYVIEPIFMYDHSGITVNTNGFSCPWDSGQVGWIFASHDTIKKEFGQINDETIEKARALLKSEVKEYDYYLTDQCYGFRLYKSNEEIASCWGFAGEIRDVQNEIKEYLPEGCKEIVESLEYRYDDAEIGDILEETKAQDEEMEV
ncbi:hypothetical protein DesLBE_3666 [Desulfitobacterium sp. LBE]|uniref:hypothetical protein n=1 Tax=Desulfitobacterium sp. LBE TaxID=884086 RepID=UPI001198FC3C|nr:hypothetical protein [Desulfitobacterium sp. LBE]TWH59291.1 hypothetical protein DesLBE_3666 [Desulfitobacterium sp. LBE]